MKNEFYKELQRYDINWRTAGSLYDIFKRRHRLMSCADEEICEALTPDTKVLKSWRRN